MRQVLLAYPGSVPVWTSIDRFKRNGDSIRQHMATLMISFLAGLFVGEGKFEEIRDNLDLERWFRLPKSHERRIHGHRHAGVRIVQDGPTLVLALDAHIAHPGLFTADDLLPYRTAREPPCQTEALNRRKVMRKARSKKQRPILLAELERRYREAPEVWLTVGSLMKDAGLTKPTAHPRLRLWARPLRGTRWPGAIGTSGMPLTASGQ
jgi:hypothetical protein